MRSKTKIAFLFLTIGDINKEQIWKEFIGKNQSSIYMHPKYPDQVKSFLKDHIIENLVNTSWGHISLVEATINLLEEAYKDKGNYKFVLVSDSCLPIKSFDYIRKYLIKDKNSYIPYYNWDDGAPYPFVKRIENRENYRKEQLTHDELKEKYTSQFQWMILNRCHANKIIKSRHLTEYFKEQEAPDEQYFITVLKYLGVSMKNISRKIYPTFCKRITPQPHPQTYDKLTSLDIYQLKNRKELFARKFSKDSNIDEHWYDIVYGEKKPPGNKKKVIIGLGTGRSGTTSFAHLLNSQKYIKCYHEFSARHLFKPLNWNHDDLPEYKKEINYDKLINNMDHLLSGESSIVGDCAYYYLPYVETLIEQYPNIKFVVIEREKQKVIDSYIEWLKDRQVDHFNDYKYDNKKKDQKWDDSYPSYNLNNLRDNLSKYWDEYHTRTEQLIEKYPEKILKTSIDTLNDENKQIELFKFLEIKEYNLVLNQIMNKNINRDLVTDYITDYKTGDYSDYIQLATPYYMNTDYK